MKNSGDLSASDFVFDRGNVNITVKLSYGSTVTGKVITEAMVLASPVWEKFMYPPWKPVEIESRIPSSGTQNTKEHEHMAKRVKTTHRSTTVAKEERAETVDYSEDDPQALLTLLRIVHLRFSRLPTDISITDLLNIAILCDQYQCVALIEPWKEQWVEALGKDSGEGNLYDFKESDNLKELGKERALFIYWTLGMEVQFTRLAKYWLHIHVQMARETIVQTWAVLSWAQRRL